MEAIAISALFVGVILAPGIVVSFFGWKATRKIQNVYLRVLLRSFILSVSFAPTIYGHAGIIPAVWVVFIGSGVDRLTYSLIPITVVWFVGSFSTLSILWIRGRLREKRGGPQ